MYEAFILFLNLGGGEVVLIVLVDLLGFTMVINALKSGDIDPQSFRFDTEDGKTVAAVFIPFKKTG